MKEPEHIIEIYIEHGSVERDYKKVVDVGRCMGVGTDMNGSMAFKIDLKTTFSVTTILRSVIDEKIKEGTQNLITPLTETEENRLTKHKRLAEIKMKIEALERDIADHEKIKDELKALNATKEALQSITSKIIRMRNQLKALQH